MDKTHLIYYCKDCKTKIHWQTAIYNKGKCKSCSHKHFTGKKNNNYKNGQWIKLHYCPICKKNIISYETWRKKGKCIKCWGKSRRGKNNSSFGITRHSKNIKYKNIYMRSSWEVAYAKWLDKQKIKWKYEPKRFNLGKLTYVPDFYLPKQNLYIEIKGYFNKKTKQKMRLFKKVYPNIKLNILREKYLKNSQIL